MQADVVWVVLRKEEDEGTLRVALLKEGGTLAAEETAAPAEETAPAAEETTEPAVETGTAETEAAAAAEAGVAEPTITPIEASIVQQAELPAEATSPAASGSEPVVLVQVESVGPLAPAMIVNQALQPGHRYRLEVTAQDGTAIAVEGNWSQAATSASGQAAAPQIEFFEGTTPYRIDIAPPVADPKMWGISVSAGFKEADLLAEGPAVVITIWDVTAGE